MTQTGIIRIGMKLSPDPCEHVNEFSSSTHYWRFLDQPIRHQLWKRSLLHQIRCHSFSTSTKKFIHSISYPRKIHSATDSSVQWLLLSVISMTLVPLSHFTFCVDIRSCAKEEGEPFVISEFHCNLFDPIRPEHSNSHHRLPSQQQHPPAH